MITEDYCDFETAKLLKEKGFQQLQNNCGYFTTEMVYSINVDKNGEHHFAHQYPAGVYNKDKYIAAPTLQRAMKWLREEHKIYIDISPTYSEVEKTIHFIWQIFDSNYDGIGDCEIFYGKYETACEEAIKYCLENLI